ncbi:hypothetical protein IPU75_08370 [Ochrobactrum sp. SD129]|nr:hypothetical protein [Ochrobactrum sp. SD129]
MNRFLADSLAFLNSLIAVALVLIGAYLGYRMPNGGLITFILGIGLGMIAATFACGVISYLALIEGHLAVLAGRQSTERTSQRREPNL